VHVASRTLVPAADTPKLGGVHDDYAAALAASPPGLVYVSLTNDAHARWVEAALVADHHVVVDKPAFTALADAERLVALAARRGRVLAEATTYLFHPALSRALGLFPEMQSQLMQATAHFTPPLPPENFRYRRALGGGAFNDLGPYLASLGRFLWGGPPPALSVSAHQDPGEEVETSFSVLADHGAGRTLIGHFGFKHEYRNWLHLAGPGLAVEVPLAFSVAPGVDTELAIRHRDAPGVVEVPAAFAMQIFLREVLSAIAADGGSGFAEALLADARVVDRLRGAASRTG